MYWIKSTTDFPYNMGGHLIPRVRTANNAYLEADETVYKELKGIPVFNALVKSGGIVVFTKRPSDIQDSPDIIKQNQKNLEAKNRMLSDEVTALKQQLADREAELKAKETELKKAAAKNKKAD